MAKKAQTQAAAAPAEAEKATDEARTLWSEAVAEEAQAFREAESGDQLARLRHSLAMDKLKLAWAQLPPAK